MRGAAVTDDIGLVDVTASDGLADRGDSGCVLGVRPGALPLPHARRPRRLGGQVLTRYDGHRDQLGNRGYRRGRADRKPGELCAPDGAYHEGDGHLTGLRCGIAGQPDFRQKSPEKCGRIAPVGRPPLHSAQRTQRSAPADRAPGHGAFSRRKSVHNPPY